MGSYLHLNKVKKGVRQNLRVLAYLARDYEFAAEATSLLSSVASLAIISK